MCHNKKRAELLCDNGFVYFFSPIKWPYINLLKTTPNLAACSQVLRCYPSYCFKKPFLVAIGRRDTGFEVQGNSQTEMTSQ